MSHVVLPGLLRKINVIFFVHIYNIFAQLPANGIYGSGHAS